MKIICIGRNYVDHAKELNNPVPKVPLMFMKPSTAILRNGKPFYYPDFTNEIHYELELVLKVCKNGRHVQPQFADSYYDHIGLGIDFTARDVQNKCKEKGHPWEIAKAFDHSAVLSQMVPLSKIKHMEAIDFELKKNNVSAQHGNSRDLIFNFNQLICHITKYFTLHKGDFIFTGTPAGVGEIKIGDQLEGYLEGELMLSCEIR
jgi:2-keto-4-pentenoate hydratase/2-oxohepta-3-ene-1,7-dioic acid hydratase in catechol pathway